MNARIQPIEMVSLAELTLSSNNPRQTVADDYIAALAGSLVEIGLIQSLAGIRTDTGIEIVAGGCRLRALRIAALERPDLDPVPVMIAPDVPTACLWAATENDLRRELKPGGIIRAARNLRARGDDVTMIARVLGSTDAAVRRALALADLPDIVLDALDAEQISWDQAKALTAAPDADRLADALIAAIDGQGAWQIRKTFEGPIGTTDHRVQFVGIEAIEAAGATIHRDLFEERVTITGEDVVDRLFAEKLELERQILLADGWAWAGTDLDEQQLYRVSQSYQILPRDLVDELTEAEAEGLEALEELGQWNLDEEQRARLEEYRLRELGSYSEAARACCGAVIFFDYSGRLTIAKGLMRPEDVERAVEAGLYERPAEKPGDKPKEADEPEPAVFSAALKDDLDNVRALALAEALAQKPELALELLAFQLTGALQYSPIFEMASYGAASIPEMDGLEISEGLTGAKRQTMKMVDDKPAALASFSAEGKKHRNAVLALELAARVKSNAGGRSMMTPLEERVGSSIRDVWTPNTDNFFGRVNGAFLDALYAELLDLDVEDHRRTSFVKLKKGQKADHMASLFRGLDLDEALQVTAKQRVLIDRWSPDLDK